VYPFGFRRAEYSVVAANTQEKAHRAEAFLALGKILFSHKKAQKTQIIL